MPSSMRPVPLQVSQVAPSRSPDPLQSGHRFSPTGASSGLPSSPGRRSGWSLMASPIRRCYAPFLTGHDLQKPWGRRGTPTDRAGQAPSALGDAEREQPGDASRQTGDLADAHDLVDVLVSAGGLLGDAHVAECAHIDALRA